MAAEIFNDLPRATNANGVPVDGAQWFFYATGTSTPQAVYSDAALTTSLGAVVTADSGGQFVPIYFNAGLSYRGVLKSASGATLRDIDPVNAGLLNDLASTAIGKGSALVANVIEVKNVKDYGALGDGATNDTAAIQAAIAACPSGGIVWFPDGNYKITAELVPPRPMTLAGNPGGAQLSIATTNTNHICIGDGTEITRNARLNVGVMGLTFAPSTGVTAFTSGACIRVQYGAFVTIEKCDFYGLDGTKKLWNAIELDRCEDSWIRDCRARQLKSSGLYTYGASGIANRTVDVVIDRFRTSDIDGDHVYFGPHSQGIFLNNWVGIGVGANRSGLFIDADPATEQGTNFFIVNPNIEGGNAANSNGIYVKKGQGVDIQGGWAGGFEPTTTNGVWFGVGASSCMINGMRFETARIDGPACSLNGCEITGALGVSTNAVSIGTAAQGFCIVGGRIRQTLTAGIAISGSPADGVISGVTFANIGSDNYITGAAYAAGPMVSGIRGQASRTATAASTVAVKYGVSLYQITGATAVGGFTLLAPGTELNVQAGSGGITINNSVNIILKSGTSLSLAAFTMRKFICDGANWFEV